LKSVFLIDPNVLTGTYLLLKKTKSAEKKKRKNIRAIQRFHE